MSGIVGYVGKVVDGEMLINVMNNLQSHRGPDGDGIYLGDKVGLGHKRLSIIDKKTGKQPLFNTNKTIVTVYNGEIYNYLDLKQQLTAKGYKFITNSDTEFIIYSYSEWGIEAFDKFNGMFAFALYDSNKKRTYLVRDHFGIKPLYYLNIGTVNNPIIIFASEIKALLATGYIKPKPNDRIIYRYLKYRIHDDGNETFFDNIYKLMPGEAMEIDHSGDFNIFEYSTLKNKLYENSKISTDYNNDRVQEYREMLKKSIRERLTSEVPVGTYLSGGLESSTIVLLANHLQKEKDPLAQSLGKKQKTFSAIYPNSINNETKYIESVLDKCGDLIVSFKIMPTADSFVEDLTDFVRTQEEPTVSTGPYEQYKVMQTASKYVNVLLDSRGADEIMGGYYHYNFVYLNQLKSQGKWLKLTIEMLKSADIFWRLLHHRLGDLIKFKKVVPVNSLLDEKFSSKYESEIFKPKKNNLKHRFIEDIFYNSLPALLRYDYKNTIRFSLEGRAPFLDKTLVEYLFSLDDESIFRGSWNKRILRDATTDILPEIIIKHRYKIGITNTEYEWFKRLKTRFYGIFMSESFVNRKYFNQQQVVNAFEGFISGKNTDTMLFWRILNVELWLREFIDEKPVETIVDNSPKKDTQPNKDKKLDLTIGEKSYRRYPIQTDFVKSDSSLDNFVANYVEAFFETLKKSSYNHKSLIGKPWYLFISEKIVAITQGRSYFIWDIKTGFWANTLSRFVVKTPYGIGLGSPYTMQLAIQEVGLPKILLASSAGAIGKLFGKKGVFYNMVGSDVRAIDGPTEYSVYPSNVSAKLPPKNPKDVAIRLDKIIKSILPKELKNSFKGVVVIDANDIGRNVLGHNTGLPEQDLEAVFSDNPLGQSGERTPLCIVFQK
jgi:asparagine synthase (glutamine-hydrolysing)